jgi:hypothetical protein
MQGTDQLYLVYLPMFNMANHRRQLIITGDVPAGIMDKYVEARRQNPDHFFTLGTANDEVITDILVRGYFDAVIDIGLPSGDGYALIAVLSNR